jgi:uncharacterized protein (DUF885 family)
MNADVEALADELVALSFRQSPVSAAMLGLDEIEGDLEDLSESAERDARSSFEAIAAKASALRHAQGDVGAYEGPDILAIDHVRLTAAARANRLQVPLTGFTVSNYYSAPLPSMIAVFPQLSVDSSLRRDRYVRRLRALPTYLEQAAQRHRDAVASGATPTARGVRVAIQQVDDVLGDPDLRGLRRRGVDDTTGAFGAAQDKAIAELVRPALSTYREVLSNDMLARGRPDEKCGMSWMTGGDEMYRRLIEFSTWSDRSAEDIHSTGLAMIEQLKGEFAEVGTRLWGTDDYAAIRDRILTDPALRFDTSEEILATAIEAVRRAEAEAPNWFGLTPKDPCAVSPIPEALASGAAVAYYYGGALDGSRPGTYFVNTTKPEIRNRHVAQSVAFHEACPGHHFQLTIAQEMAGAHLVFRVTRDGTNAEGWGLYSERLAHEMGLYTDDIALLGMLTTDAMRAARLVVDTGLHALGWSRQQAIGWMTANVPLGEPDIVQEIDRYIVSPGQALSYMFGRLELDRLRKMAREELGESFDLRAFHDMVLVTGPVALPAFTAAVERWVDSQR